MTDRKNTIRADNIECAADLARRIVTDLERLEHLARLADAHDAKTGALTIAAWVANIADALESVGLPHLTPEDAWAAEHTPAGRTTCDDLVRALATALYRTVGPRDASKFFIDADSQALDAIALPYLDAIALLHGITVRRHTQCAWITGKHDV